MKKLIIISLIVIVVVIVLKKLLPNTNKALIARKEKTKAQIKEQLVKLDTAIANTVAPKQDVA